MKTALVLDDTKTVRTIMRRILEELGYRVLEAEHGLQGLEVLAENPDVDLAMVDWNMPEMDGLEFVQSVRKEPSNACIQMMMVTTEAQLERVVAAMEAGANEYLMKPFTKEMVIEKLRILGVE